MNFDKKKERLLLLILAMIQFTHILDFMIIMPLGPQIKRMFGIEAQQFGFIVSAYTFSAGFMGIWGAFFIDRFDRKHALNISYAGFIVGTFLCGIANSYTTLVLTRVIAGAFGGLIGGLVFSIVADIFPFERRGKAMGVIMSAFSIASVAGVPIGLYFAREFEYRVPFFMLAALSLVILVFSYIQLPSIRVHLKDKVHLTPKRTLVMIFNNQNHLWAFALIMVMMFAGFSVIPYISIYLVSNVGIKEDDLLYIYLLGGGFTLFTARIIGYLADKYGKQKVFIASAVLSMIPILATTHLPRVSLLLVLTVTTSFFIFLSGRMIPAMAMVTSSVLPQNRGGFMSMNSSLQQISAGFASLIAGAVLQNTASGQLLNYNIVGYISCISTLISIYLVGKIEVRS